MIIRLIVKALVILFVLPYLGLIAFTGGFGSALLTAIIAGIAGVLTTWVLFPALASVGVVSVVAGGIVGGGLGARAVVFAISTAIYAIALWLTALILSSVVLLGFWPTIGAAALLGLVGAIFSE